MEESKTSRARVAFVLLCGLAVCCGVMYATADGAEETALEGKHSVGSGQDVFNPRSIESVDVKKSGMLYTKTPDTSGGGRERLLDFFNKVEANIAKEVQSRKSDIAAIRAQMAKNMELNQAARKKMRSALLKKMAANAKHARDELAREMRKTQKKFADVAAFESARNRADIKRFRATRKLMRKNKAEARRALHAATHAQQRALASLDAATNAKIKKTNAHIAANAAQMKVNAKKARADLDKAMNAFDHKMNNARALAKAGRSKLAAQAAAQDKKFREDASNQVKAAVAAASAEFAKVNKKMADDRAHADAELAHASSRMDAALNARKVLQDKRFAETVSDIAAAKKEAADRVAKFESHFKTGILKLQSTAKQQTAQLEHRQAQLANTVTNNRLQQAVVNNKVNAELKRMVALGDKRYKQHLKQDAELESLMKKNREATKARMEKMTSSFMASIDKIKAQAKKDRAHAENALAGKTNELYNTLASNVDAQNKKNKELSDATLAMAHAAKENLRNAKADFTRKLAALDSKVESNMKKNNKAILSLTGIVEADAVKNAAGRQQLKAVSDSNRKDMEAAVQDAIEKGEARAVQLEKKMKKVNDKTRKALTNRVQFEITKLRKSVHGQLDEIKLESAEARKAMRAEILGAVSDAAKVAKQNLKKTVEWSEGELSQLNAKLLAEQGKSAGARAKLSAQIADDKKHAMQQIADAVAAENAALLVEKQQINAAIKKTNKELSAQADNMKKNAEAVSAQMKANSAAIQSSLEAARKASVAQLAAVSAASAERYNSVVKAVKTGVEAATKAANAKFDQLTIDMANQRKAFAEKMSGSVSKLNDALAKDKAIREEQFSKTVKDLAAAQAAAKKDVREARTEMNVNILAAKAKAKEAEENVQGKLAVVTGMIISNKAKQHIINKNVDSELERIVELSNKHQTANSKARGAIKVLMDKNKAAAAAATAALAKRANADIAKARGTQARNLRQFKQDLTKSTEKVYQKMAADSAAQQEAMSGLNAQLTSSKAATAASLKKSKALFVSRTDTLLNKITQNAAAYERNIGKATGVVTDWKKASAADRKNIRTVRDAMVSDLHKDIERAIQTGEARAKQVEEEAMANIATAKKSLLTTIGESVENMADNVFATIQGNRKKTADNYLSLKAYAATAADKVQDYLAKGKGRNLSSIGDLLKTVGGLAGIRAKPAKGIGFGAKAMTSAFSGKKIDLAGAGVSKVNGLVNEYIGTLGQVKARWPMGLGHYLLAKLEVAMQGTGALEVDKVSDKAGNFVFINAHAVGLSSKLSDFEGLAVRMGDYERALAKLTAKLPTIKVAAKRGANVPPPEWQGD